MKNLKFDNSNEKEEILLKMNNLKFDDLDKREKEINDDMKNIKQISNILQYMTIKNKEI